MATGYDVSCKAVASENWAPCVHDRERSIQKKMESTQGLFPVPEEHPKSSTRVTLSVTAWVLSALLFWDSHGI
ncbi:hypothetical protein R6Z07F_004318 [Ovis aries]